MHKQNSLTDTSPKIKIEYNLLERCSTSLDIMKMQTKITVIHIYVKIE